MYHTYQMITVFFLIFNLEMNKKQTQVTNKHNLFPSFTATFSSLRSFCSFAPPGSFLQFTWQSAETHHETLIGRKRCEGTLDDSISSLDLSEAPPSLMLSAWCHNSLHPKMAMSSLTRWGRGNGFTHTRAHREHIHILGSAPFHYSPKKLLLPNLMLF